VEATSALLACPASRWHSSRTGASCTLADTGMTRVVSR
jgi:hypothetical protein